MDFVIRPETILLSSSGSYIDPKKVINTKNISLLFEDRNIKLVWDPSHRQPVILNKNSICVGSFSMESSKGKRVAVFSTPKSNGTEDYKFLSADTKHDGDFNYDQLWCEFKIQLMFVDLNMSYSITLHTNGCNMISNVLVL